MTQKRSMTDFPRNEAGLVDNFLGTAYDVVKNVYDNMDALLNIDSVIDDIDDLAQEAVDEAMEEAMVEIDAAVDEANEAADRAEAAANKGNAVYDFIYVAAQPVYDVITISGKSDTTTVGMTLLIQGCIDYNFTILSNTTFQIDDGVYLEDGIAMKLMLHPQFGDVLHDLDEEEQARQDEFDEAMIGWNEYVASIDSDAYVLTARDAPIDYAAGLLINKGSTSILQDGVLYQPYVAQLPFTTTTWATDQYRFFAAGDAALRQELLNSTDMTQGVTKVGGATRHVKDLATLKTIPGRYNLDLIFLERVSTNYNTGSGNWMWQATNTLTPDDVTIVAVAGIATGRWLRQYSALTVGMFGSMPVVGFDNAPSFAAVCTFLRNQKAAGKQLPAIHFEPGIYEQSVSPNWGIKGAVYLNIGEVHIRGTGTGPVWSMDGGSGTAGEVTIGQGSGFIFENGPTATTPTCYLRNVYFSSIHAEVWGAGAGQAAWQVLGCILNHFEGGAGPNGPLTGDANYTGGWYKGAKPFAGLSIDQSAAGAQSTYNTFTNWYCAACDYGMYAQNCFGNVWLSGDCEYCTTMGAIFLATAVHNRIVGMNFEVNPVDIECAGFYNSFDCDSTLFKITGGEGNQLVGGVHDQISILGGSGAYVGGVVYGRGISGNLVIIDTPALKTAYGWCFQAQSKEWTRGPKLDGVITVGASPFTYQNTTGRPMKVFVSGGAVSNMSYYRGATLLGAFATNVVIELAVGDALSVVYTTAPTIKWATV